VNYARVYRELVAKNYEGDYLEAHHIQPKCVGGSDAPENIVRLTARGHFIAHWLLHKMYPENIKIAQAFAVMRHGSRFHKRVFTSHGFAAAKKAHSMETSFRMKTNNPMRNPEYAKKIATQKMGVPLSASTKALISHLKTGVTSGPRPESVKQLQRGIEYHDPVTGKTVRFKIHLNETPPNNWVRGRLLKEKHIWVTDGVKNLRIKDGADVPSGFFRGRRLHKDAAGKVTKCPL